MVTIQTIQSVLNIPVLTVADVLFLGFVYVVTYGVACVLDRVWARRDRSLDSSKF